MKAEEVVRKVWKAHETVTTAGCDSTGIVLDAVYWRKETRTKEDIAAWSAALDFTARRLKEVRDAREELKALERCKEWTANLSDMTGYHLQSAIDKRLKPALATLTAGLTEWALEHLEEAIAECEAVADKEKQDANR